MVCDLCSAVLTVLIFRKQFITHCWLLFVAIGNAFAVLSNPEKRQRYDRFGTEEEQVPVMSERHFFNNGGYEYDFTRGFEGEYFVVDEILVSSSYYRFSSCCSILFLSHSILVSLCCVLWYLCEIKFRRCAFSNSINAMIIVTLC